MNTHKEPNWCKTSQQWVEELYPAGNPVVDPDGWDRKDFEYSWYQEPISKDEFEKRLMNSTLRMPPVLVEPTPPSQIEEDPFDFVEPCEPDCTPERHAYHQGQWDMAIRMNESKGYRGYPGAVEDEEPWQYVNNTK